jgi:glycerol kinase
MPILALDQGTTSSRAVVFDNAGHIVSLSNRALTQLYPKPGWVEHDPEEILLSVLGSVREALQKGGLQARDMDVLGLTNQRETVVVWDRRTGAPVCNAIVWQCRRTAEFCTGLVEQGLEPMIRQKTGLVADAYFSASKLRWILDCVPDARRRAGDGELLCGTVDAYLLFMLSGGRIHATDHTNASRTMLYNLHTHDWDDGLLGLFGVPRAMLPKIRSSSEIYGVTDGDVMGAEIPIGGVAGDQQAALFGQCCFAPGEAKNTYGTGCFMLMHTGHTPSFSNSGLLTTMAANRKGEPFNYALEGSVFAAGAVVQWLRDELHLIDSSAQSEALALSVPDTGGVVLVPAFTGLGAPHWDGYARGTLFGITRGTGRAHIVRAGLESIALQTHDVLCAMAKDNGIKLLRLKVDGGACANDFLMQYQADLLNIDVERPKITETTALGAATLAGLAAGIFGDEDELREQWAADTRFVPGRSEQWRTDTLTLWNRAISRSLGWLCETK